MKLVPMIPVKAISSRETEKVPRYGFLFLFAALFLFFPFFSVTARAQASQYSFNSSGGYNDRLSVDPLTSEGGYCAVLYDNTSGLPTSEANAIAQTSEGCIWIGSYSGLIRFDGNSFVRMDSTRGVASVVCLYTDTRDRLWIGTNDNGVAVLEKGQLTKWGKAEGLSSSYINAITEDGHKTIYVGTT